MMNLAEYRRTAQPASPTILPWAALVAPGVVLNKDGSFQRTARFRGPDLDSATPAELVGDDRAGSTTRLRRLGSGWAIFVEAQRLPAQRYPHEHVSRSRLGAGRRRAPGRTSRRRAPISRAATYLTFVWLPPAEDAARAEAWLYEGRAQTGRRSARDRCAASSTAPIACSSWSRASCPNAAWLDDAETLTYLHSTISTRRQRVRVPETPMYLDALLADQPLDGRARAAARRRASAHRSRSSASRPQPRPGSSTSSTGSPFPIAGRPARSCSTRPTPTRLLTKIRRQWFAKRKSIAAILKEVMTNEASVLVDTDAANKAADADMACRSSARTMSARPMSPRRSRSGTRMPRVADEKLRLVEKVIQGRDFTCMRRDASTRSRPGSARCPAMSTPMSASRRSPPSISPT